MTTIRSNHLFRALALGICLIGLSAQGHGALPRTLSGSRPTGHLDSGFTPGRSLGGPGSSFRGSPSGRLDIGFGHRHYFYHGGYWYQPWGLDFLAVLPPVGILLPFLPPDYVQLEIAGGSPYYYANGSYYQSWPEGGYVVVDPPASAREGQAPSPKPAPPSSILSIFPRNGQSEERMEADRGDAHRFALGQSGFDPGKMDPGHPNYLQLQKDYLRSFKAFLEGRGYSVK